MAIPAHLLKVMDRVPLNHIAGVSMFTAIAFGFCACVGFYWIAGLILYKVVFK